MREEQEIIRLIAKYLAGEAGEDETRELNEWIHQSDVNKKLYFQIKNIWDLSDRSIDQGNIDTSEALQEVRARMKDTRRRIGFWRWWQRVAAVLIIPFLLGALYLYFHKTEEKPALIPDARYSIVRTAHGNRTEITLSDGTKVLLDASSKLTYPEKFEGRIREVSLDGHAYFQVKSDRKMPFIVNTCRLQVYSTGTTFDVCDYKDKPESQITLVSGKIAVSEIIEGNQRMMIADLKPDQSLSYNSSLHKIEIRKENAYEQVAWKDGLLIFRNEPMGKVVEKLSEVFEVDIELTDKSLENYRYRATFQDETLSEILKLLKISSPIDYVELERKPLPDGTFEPRKVLIFRAERK